MVSSSKNIVEYTCLLPFHEYNPQMTKSTIIKVRQELMELKYQFNKCLRKKQIKKAESVYTRQIQLLHQYLPRFQKSAPFYVSALDYEYASLHNYEKELKDSIQVLKESMDKSSPRYLSEKNTIIYNATINLRGFMANIKDYLSLQQFIEKHDDCRFLFYKSKAITCRKNSSSYYYDLRHSLITDDITEFYKAMNKLINKTYKYNKPYLLCAFSKQSINQEVSKAIQLLIRFLIEYQKISLHATMTTARTKTRTKTKRSPSFQIYQTFTQNQYDDKIKECTQKLDQLLKGWEASRMERLDKNDQQYEERFFLYKKMMLEMYMVEFITFRLYAHTYV